MSIFAGVVSRERGGEVPEALRAALRAAVSRHPGESVEEDRLDGAHLVSVDFAAFPPMRARRTSPGGVTLVAGRPLLTDGDDGEALAEILGRSEWSALRDADGTFCAAHYAGAERALTLAVDAVGVRPLYYHVGERFVVFATALRILEALDVVPKRMDVRAVTEISRLGYPLAFVVTRMHKRGELGNAVLSRWPLAGALAIDLSFGRLERRAALAVSVRGGERSVVVAATHLALVDRTRARQVRALLDHPQLADGAAVLVGDMNAWRPTKASRQLDDAFQARHHNADWPASYPSVRPVLALDRLYARGARVLSLDVHMTEAARRGSDHLPIVARLQLEE